MKDHGAIENPAQPFAIFIDGLPYALDDSVIGFWNVDVITGVRQLSAILRKRRMCRCGCRGWCSLYPFFQSMRWQYESLSRGEYPLDRPDHKAWVLPQDAKRANKQGISIGFRGACIWLKGDWMERITTLGFPSWNDGLRPCAE